MFVNLISMDLVLISDVLNKVMVWEISYNNYIKLKGKLIMIINDMYYIFKFIIVYLNKIYQIILINFVDVVSLLIRNSIF